MAGFPKRAEVEEIWEELYSSSFVGGQGSTSSIERQGVDEPPLPCTPEASSDRRGGGIPPHATIYADVRMTTTLVTIGSLLVWKIVLIQTFGEEPVHAPLVHGGRFGWGVEKVIVYRFEKVVDRPLEIPLGDVKIRDDSVEVEVFISGGYHEVAPSSLGDSERCRVQCSREYAISRLAVFAADSLEDATSGLDGARPVVPGTWDVLDDDVVRPKNLGGPCHSRVQAILWIVAARVVVEVGVPLARWPSNEQIERPGFETVVFDGFAFSRGWLGSELSVEQGLHSLGVFVRRSKVVRVNRKRASVDIVCELDVHAATERSAGLLDAQRQPAAASEEVDERDGVCRVRLEFLLLGLQPSSVELVAGTAFLPSRLG